MGANMSIRKAINWVLTVLLLPVCLGWFLAIYNPKSYPGLYNIAAAVTAVLVLALLFHNIYWCIFRREPLTKLRCFFIARMACGPVKKLKRIVTKSHNLSIVAFSIQQLKKIVRKEGYIAMLRDIQKHEKHEGKRDYLLQIIIAEERK
jgi:uncharacterized membrane protein YhdT